MIEPNNPNRCMGRFPKVDKNQMVIKSRKPLMKRLIPNLELPYFLAW